jgi:hypothetical protein
VAASLFAATGAEARSHGGALIAGAVAGMAVGVLAGSALAAPEPAPIYVYRAPPPRPARAVNVYHTEVWVDHPPHDWSEPQDDDDDDCDDDE